MIVYEEAEEAVDTGIHTPYTHVKNSVSRKNILKNFLARKLFFFIYFSYLCIKKHTFIYSQWTNPIVALSIYPQLSYP